jgi:hypothetical protein
LDPAVPELTSNSPSNDAIIWDELAGLKDVPVNVVVRSRSMCLLEVLFLVFRYREDVERNLAHWLGEGREL